MRYTDEQFDALLTRALKLAVKEEWDGKGLDVPIPLSPSGGEKMQQLLSGKENSARTIKPKRPAYLRRIAAAVLAVLALGGITLTNPSARAYLEKLIKTWFPDHVQYELTEEAESRTPDSFEIGYIPDGYQLVKKSYMDDIYCYYSYKNENDTMLAIDISSQESIMHLDNEHYKYTQTIKDEKSIDVYEAIESDYPNIVVSYFEDDNIIICISGYFSITELQEILDEIH